MCIAAPMRIVKTDCLNEKARASLNGNELEIDIRLVNAKEGDFVLVHAGCALEIISENSAAEIAALLKDLEDSVRNGY